MINVEWVQRLESVRGKLTKREQEIVNYLEEHIEQFPELSMQDLVEATNTSRPTVHRFCVKLGYNGFKAFKQAMLPLTQPLPTSGLDFNPRTLTPKISSDAAIADAASSFDLFQKGFSVDIQALQRSASLYAEQQIDTIVTLILQAETLYCVGYQSGIFPARFLAERLCRLRCKTRLATGEHRAILDAVFALETHDLLLLFEYHKDFDLDLKLCDLARQRGACCILMTDYPTSPVVTRADETLIVHRGLPGFKNSMAVPMTVVNNLLLAVEYALGDEREKYLQEWDELQE